MRHRLKEKLIIGGVLVAFLVGAGTSPAFATSGTGYDGTDPASTGCATGSVDIKDVNLYIGGTSTLVGYMQVRYSPSCGTNWVRVYNIGTSDAVSKTFVQRPAQGSLPDSGPIGSADAYPGGWAYGPQVYATGSTCIYAQAGLVTSAWTAWSSLYYLC